MLTFIFTSSLIWLPAVANRLPIVQQLLKAMIILNYKYLVIMQQSLIK